MKNRNYIFKLSLVVGIVIYPIAEFLFIIGSPDLISIENGVDFDFNLFRQLVFNLDMAIILIPSGIIYSFLLAAIGKIYSDQIISLAGFRSNLVWIIVFCISGFNVGIVTSITIVPGAFFRGREINELYPMVFLLVNPAATAGVLCSFVISFIWRRNIMSGKNNL